ncbi:caspase family protein [Pendulispora rubella]|uniref:Caspase family protein n=1 Tax=Pendulispora rubella TaxID=2741070 RepID=A0ABZ2KZE8_9BACT
MNAFVRFVAQLAGCALALLVAKPAMADVERFGLILGNNVGSPEQAELRYAESDAEKIRDTLQSLGRFDPDKLVLLQGESADTVRKALAGLGERLRLAASKPNTQVVLFAYYSGHADGAALHLRGSALPLGELEQWVRASAAEFRLLILDACRSGALTRVKGGTRAPPVEIRTEGSLAREGLLFWTASAANEDAQESDAIKGSFFSHYLNSALLGAGDVDGDGNVSVEEAYRYASENTVRASSATFGGTQHPTFRYELSGYGKLELTTLWEHTSGRATLVVPAGKPYLVFRDSSSGPVVGEIGASDRARHISVRPGTYFLRARAPDALLEGRVRVGAWETREVRDADLSRSAYARLVRKGGVRSSAFFVGAGAQVHTALSNATGTCFGGYGEVGIHWEALTGQLRVGVCRAAFDNGRLQGTVDEATAQLRLVRVIDLRSVSPYFGIEAGALFLSQNFDLRNGSASDSRTFGMTGAGVLGVSLELAGGFALSAEGAFALYLYPLENAVSGETKRQADLSIRPSVGLSKTW